jgi:hypothetical protein
MVGRGIYALLHRRSFRGGRVQHHPNISRRDCGFLGGRTRYDYFIRQRAGILS